jgi:DNA-directed RNA polymerase specialized sigma24 family protein
MPDTRAEDEAAERYAAHYREHNARLVAYARSLTGSAAVAEDLVAEAHFRVWRRIRAGHPVENVAAYLTTTVRNLAAGLGRAQREIAGDVAQLPEDPARAESAPQDPERRASHVDLISRSFRNAGRRRCGTPRSRTCRWRRSARTSAPARAPRRSC